MRSSGNKRRRFTEADLLRAAEAILLALLIAARETPWRRERTLAAVRSSSDPAAAEVESRVAAVG